MYWTELHIKNNVLYQLPLGYILIGKDPDSGKVWRQKEKRVAEDKRVREYHWLNGHAFEQTPGDSEDREAWHATVQGVTKSQSRLSNWKTTCVQALPTTQSLLSGTHVIAISGLWAGTWDIRVVTEVYVLAFTQPLLPRKGLHHWPASVFLCLLGSQSRCDQQFLHFGIHSTNNYWDSSLG